jgi:2-iminobutanoate/2-iminopropanoate deaminase
LEGTKVKERVSTDNAPRADHILSQGIVSNGNIYVAGQVYSKPDGTIIDGSVEDKVDQIMSNISAILEAAGAGLDSVVKVVIYVTNMSQMPELNAVYPTYFKEPYPVREAVCVKALPLGATIEISVVAAK